MSEGWFSPGIALEMTHVGLMLVIFSPDLDLTNSLFMKRPTGCLYSRPLGALRCTNRSEVMLSQRVEGSFDYNGRIERYVREWISGSAKIQRERIR